MITINCFAMTVYRRSSLGIRSQSSPFRPSRLHKQLPWTPKRQFVDKKLGNVPPKSEGGDPFGFAFDIDGVLLRGKTPVPGARQALEKLKDRKIPFVLLTNGGGKLEVERAHELSELLETSIPSESLIQGHTSFQDLVDEHQFRGSHTLGDGCVLVVGGEGNKCREIAESYGFRNVITPADIVTADHTIWPFANLDLYRSYARPLPKPLCPPGLPETERRDEFLVIGAIFVFHDSRDWGLDAQIIVDLIRSNGGCLGMRKRDLTMSEKGPERPHVKPRIYFSNVDDKWQADHKFARLGQGAFLKAVRGCWNAYTGNRSADLEIKVRGKPSWIQFAYAHKRIEAQYSLLSNKEKTENDRQQLLRRIYMIGDNPMSDIQGANLYNLRTTVPWFPILTSTGIYHGSGNLLTNKKPTHMAKDVLTAVDWALDDSQKQRSVEPELYKGMMASNSRYLASVQKSQRVESSVAEGTLR